MSNLCVLCAICYGVTWVKLLHNWHITVSETYFIGEELHEILQNSSNKEYKENEHSEGSNVEIDREADETEKSALQGEDNGRKNRNFPCFIYNQTFFYISLI
jgi:hypothetical protein